MAEEIDADKAAREEILSCTVTEVAEEMLPGSACCHAYQRTRAVEMGFKNLGFRFLQKKLSKTHALSVLERSRIFKIWQTAPNFQPLNRLTPTCTVRFRSNLVYMGGALYMGSDPERSRRD